MGPRVRDVMRSVGQRSAAPPHTHTTFDTIPCVCVAPHPSFRFHMGVDGASRNMAWLAVVPSNRDPVQILQLYVGALKEHGDWVKLRIDPGSENTLVASVHERLRAADNKILCADHDAAYNIFYSCMPKYREPLCLSWIRQLVWGTAAHACDTEFVIISDCLLVGAERC